jgi:AcrR family transcriptional regulator
MAVAERTNDNKGHNLVPRPKGARDADYAVKRSALLRKLSARLIQLDDTRPSLRQLAIAAGVTVPTLRHYFGDREDLVEAVLEEFFVHGERYLEQGGEPNGELEHSVRAFLKRFAEVLVEGPKLGDMIAIAFLEGFYSRRLGPAALNFVIEPPLQAMERRLAAHQARGELGDIDLRCAALMLISPLVVACMHQQQMFGDQVRPLNVAPVIDSSVSSFMKAYGVPASSSEPLHRLAAV